MGSAQIATERAVAGWSWETNSRQRAAMIAATLTTYGDVCHLCRRPGADTADHLTPRSRGGLHVLGNLRPAHGPCNAARGDAPLTEWFARHPVPHRTTLPPSRQW